MGSGSTQIQATDGRAIARELGQRPHPECLIERQLRLVRLAAVRKHAQQVIWLHRGEVRHGTVAELFTPERMAEIFEMEVG